MAADDGENQAIWPTDIGPSGSAVTQAPLAPGGSVAPAPDQQPDPVLPFTVASPYPPIADYAFLSDCEVTALIAPSGAVEWMCLPRMDCPSVFGSLLDRDAGWFRFGPEDMTVPADRR